MTRKQLVLAVAALFVAQTAWVLTQTAKPPGPLKTERVKGDLYMISGEGGNVALYATSEGVILVDDMFDRNHDDILKQIKTVTDKPLKYVINTHQHDDHAGGDFKMLPLAEVIAHKNVRANLKDIKRPYYEDTPGTPIGLPRITFTDELDVNLGDKVVQAHYFGRGHTQRRRRHLLPGAADHSHRRPVPQLPAGAGPRRRAAAAAGPADLRRLQPGRQPDRVGEDGRRHPAARLRHHHPGPRGAGHQGRPRDVSRRRGGDGDAPDGAHQGREAARRRSPKCWRTTTAGAPPAVRRARRPAAACSISSSTR